MGWHETAGPRERGGDLGRGKERREWADLEEKREKEFSFFISRNLRGISKGD
jgi:hypothetical protein